MNDLEFLQSISEQELCELVLLPLLTAIGFSDIRYTHGILEYGKDIVCSKLDPIDGHKYISFAVKSKALDGSVSSSRSVREVYYQLKQSLTEPFVNPFDGREIKLDQAYLLTPFSISQLCIRSIKEEMREQSAAISFIDGPKLLDLLRQYVPDLLSALPDPKHRYLNTLLLRFLQTRTLSSFGTLREFTLPEIYTGGYLSSTTIEEAKYLSFLRGDYGEGKNIHNIFPDNKFIILLADVGAGKTTLLQKLALDLISLPDGSLNPNPALLPFFIRLSAIPPEKTLDKEQFTNWIQDQIAQNFDYEAFSNFKPRERLLLLDGFDEVSSGHENLPEYIQDLSLIFEGGVILTSRPSRIPMLTPPYVYFKLNPFKNEDILEFLKKWFPGDAPKVSELFEHITNDEILLRFCRTPLLLTLYTALASTTKLDALPTRRTDIYDAVTKLLLDDWDAMRNVTNQFSYGVKLFCLESIAYSAHQQTKKEFYRWDLIRLAERVLKSGNKNLEVNASALVDELLFRSSLIRLNENRNLEFVHLSFQEFFSARHLMRLGDIRTVQKILFVDWWKNTLTFYFGLVRGMDEIRLTEKKATGTGHILIEYLSEAEYTSEKVRDIVLLIMAKQILASFEFSESVVDVCRRFSSELLLALQNLLVRYKEEPKLPYYIYNYFRFITSLGVTGGPAAIQELPLLGQLGHKHLISILQEALNHLTDGNWQDFFLKGLDVLRDAIARERLMFNRTEKEEFIKIMEEYIHKFVQTIESSGGLDSKRRANMLARVKKLENSFDNLK